MSSAVPSFTTTTSEGSSASNTALLFTIFTYTAAVIFTLTFGSVIFLIRREMANIVPLSLGAISLELLFCWLRVATVCTLLGNLIFLSSENLNILISIGVLVMVPIVCIVINIAITLYFLIHVTTSLTAKLLPEQRRIINPLCITTLVLMIVCCDSNAIICLPWSSTDTARRLQGFPVTWVAYRSLGSGVIHSLAIALTTISSYLIISNNNGNVNNNGYVDNIAATGGLWLVMWISIVMLLCALCRWCLLWYHERLFSLQTLATFEHQYPTHNHILISTVVAGSASTKSEGGLELELRAAENQHNSQPQQLRLTIGVSTASDQVDSYNNTHQRNISER